MYLYSFNYIIANNHGLKAVKDLKMCKNTLNVIFFFIMIIVL